MRILLVALCIISCHPKPKDASHNGPRGHAFQDPEEYAKRWNDPARDEWQKPQEVISALAITSGMKVADIGAGTGYFTPHLSKAVGDAGRVLALDIENSMIAYLQDRISKEGWKNVEARQVKTDDPLLEAASVERILIVNTWHHIWEREAYAKKLSAAVSSGGMLMIVDYTIESKNGPPEKEKLSAEQVAKELTAGGFSAQILQETLPEQYIVIGKKE